MESQHIELNFFRVFIVTSRPLTFQGCVKILSYLHATIQRAIDTLNLAPGIYSVIRWNHNTDTERKTLVIFIVS